MHEVKTQCHGASCLPKHVYFLIFYMVIIKNYKVKKLFNKFLEISRKIGINFRKFSEGNFRTHNPSGDTVISLLYILTLEHVSRVTLGSE